MEFANYDRAPDREGGEVLDAQEAVARDAAGSECLGGGMLREAEGHLDGEGSGEPDGVLQPGEGDEVLGSRL